jgi:hypothetical protein
MNSHTSPCDHMTLFVAKSSPERRRVPRRVNGRLMVRRLVNINPTSQELHQPRHQENPSTNVSGHQEVNPRASSSSAHMASSSETSRKRGREEDDDESCRHRLVKEGTPLALEEPEEVPPSAARPTSPRRCHRPRLMSPRRCRRQHLTSPRMYPCPA